MANARVGESGRGRLTIYFGMAAGVGTTSRMLSDALRRSAAGQKVLIGCIESHCGEDLRSVAANLGGSPLSAELDVDALLATRANLVLVDGLAHRNPPQARNRGRHQDVMELLDRGIDVATTLTIQELESYADVVEEITGRAAPVRVSDAVMEAAHEVVMVDITPEELRRRLDAGTVYLGGGGPEQVERSFGIAALARLREVALRYVAALTARRLGAEQKGRGTSPSGAERILVAVGPSPSSAYLLRWARQRAFGLGAEWTALHVDTGRALSEGARDSLRRNLELARQLGAGVITVASEEVVEALLAYARAHEVTEIVVGRSGDLPRWFLRRRSVAGRLLMDSGDIAVAVVHEKKRGLLAGSGRTDLRPRAEPVQVVVALLVIAAATAIGLAVRSLVGYRPVLILFLLAILGLSFVVSRLAVLVAAVATAPLVPYFFLPPRNNFGISSLEDVLMYVLYVATAVSLASLMSRLRRNESLLSARERRLEMVIGFSQALSVKQSVEGIVRAGMEHASRSFEADVAIYLKGEGGELATPRRATTPPSEIEPGEIEAARWCCDKRAPCGRFTDTFHGARYHYVPLVGPEAVVGVLGVCPPARRPWMPEQEHTLRMLASTLSLSLEREMLAESNKRHLMARESERLGKLLLNTVSHHLRTPLTTIKGSITAMMDPGMDEGARSLLLGETLEAAERLNATVENILSMNRLESGMLRLRRSDTDVADLASVVADSVRDRVKRHPFTIRLPEAMPPVYVDIVLMVQAIANLVLNAVSHTPDGTRIELAIAASERDLRVTVADTGPGVPPEELPRLFDTFWRGRKAGSGGIGLGLSICKGIVGAHGGSVSASLGPAGGLRVELVIPGCVGEREVGG